MNDAVQSNLTAITRSQSVTKLEEIQTLWSGYGDISRYQLNNDVNKTVVVKHVKLPKLSELETIDHPRGWNTELSHHRKVKSYHVESHWYETYSQLCSDHCRIPHCYGVKSLDKEVLLVLEDLDASGFSLRKSSASYEDIEICISWLAHFHGQFIYKRDDVLQDISNNQKIQGLWSKGCYWHLDTRPDELTALSDVRLKDAAIKLDQLLEQCPYQTIVHGDAKLANFCFSEDGNKVAAVDFQYVGGGCGMKDLAYFIGSCLNEADCEKLSELLLNEYFLKLKEAINKRSDSINADEVERYWRPLFAVAWADFHRFMKGWSPNHWKVNRYSETITQKVLDEIDSGKLVLKS